MTTRLQSNHPPPLAWVAAISGISSCTAELSTFPFDWAKTRLQLSGQRSMLSPANHFTPKISQGMVNVMYEGVREKGFGVLFTGVKPALVRQATYGTMKMTYYQHLKRVFSSPKIPGDYTNIAAAVASGAVSSAICTPTDLLKVRLQGGDSRYCYTGVWNGFSSIVKGEGWRGLYKGIVPTTQRATLISLLTLPTYDYAKKWLISRENQGSLLHKDDIRTHILASVFSAVVSTLGTQPIDVIKTRMMNQAFDESGKGLLYVSSFDCLMKTASAEGITACWKGTIPTFFRSGPWLVVFWVAYEQLQRFGIATHSL